MIRYYLILLLVLFGVSRAADIVITVGASGHFATVNTAISDSVVDVTAGNNAVVRIIDAAHTENITFSASISADTLIIEGNNKSPASYVSLQGGIYKTNTELLKIRYLEIHTGFAPAATLYAGVLLDASTGSATTWVEWVRIRDVTTSDDRNTYGFGTQGQGFYMANTVIHSITNTRVAATSRELLGVECSASGIFMYNVTVDSIAGTNMTGKVRGIDNHNTNLQHIYNVSVSRVSNGGSGNFREWHVTATNPAANWSHVAYQTTAPGSGVTNKVQIDPATDYEDYLNHDYTPASGSGLIDAGISTLSDSSWFLANSDTAYNQVLRSGTWDIGAIELSASAVTAYPWTVPAFPGAQGFGRDTRHAFTDTSQSFYEVTTTASSGAGSLRDALSQSNRVIVFNVADTIKLQTNITATNIDHIRIAGETAPGRAVVVAGAGIVANGIEDWFISNFVLARGDSTDGGSGAGDAFLVSGDGMKNVYWYRSNTIWGSDESLDIDGATDSVSFDLCIIGQTLHNYSQNNHAYSTLFGSTTNNARLSLFRCLITNGARRNPKLQFLSSSGNPVGIDIVNNIIYGWTSQPPIHTGSQGDDHNGLFNVRNNWFKEYNTGAVDSLLSIELSNGTGDWDFFFDGNLYDNGDGVWQATTIADHVQVSSNASPFVDTLLAPFSIPEAYQIELASEEWIRERVGPINADSITVRLRNEYATRSSVLGGNGLLDSLGQLRTAQGYDYPTDFSTFTKLPDADNDNIPDAFDDKPNTFNAWEITASGYTKWEEYNHILLGVSGDPESFANFNKFNRFIGF